MRDLSRLLRPRSIAVLGSVWAQNVIIQCNKMGYDGQIWPVHPTKSDIGGVPCFQSLSDLPSAPDATFIGVNRFATIEVVAELSAMGAGGAICFASGWRETGDDDLQTKLVAAAGPMPILGPNCYGVLNYLDGAAIWPDQHGGKTVQSGVAIISQSSNIAISLTMQRRALPIAYVACLGNAAQSGAAEIAHTFLQDERVTALGFYLEGIENAGEFARVAQAARTAGKGLVAIKSGKTEAGVAAAASHTAALAGSAAASSAFLRQCGIAEVATLAELVETLKIYHFAGPLKGLQIASCSCSGGEAGLVADLAAGTNLEFPDLSKPQLEILSETLGPLVTLSNPLDYHTFIWGDRVKTETVFSTMLSEADAGIYIIDPPRSDICDPTSFEPAIDAIGFAAKHTRRPAFAVSTIPDSNDEELCARYIAKGVIPLGGIDSALAAIDAAGTPAGFDGWRPIEILPEYETDLLAEDAAKSLLSKIGINTPKGVSAATLPDLANTTQELHKPLALKGLGFAHKSEADAVRLNVQDISQEPEIANADGYLAEEMVQDGLTELIIGLRRDQNYGASLTIGFGGTQAELLQDVETLILPVTGSDIENALRSLTLWPLLDGYRGRPKPKMETVVNAALSLQSAFMADNTLAEIEINPLILTKSKAIAVDALIRKAQA